MARTLRPVRPGHIRRVCAAGDGLLLSLFRVCAGRVATRGEVILAPMTGLRETASRGPLLAAQGISKRFGRVQALEDVDFDVHAGEVVALVGPAWPLLVEVRGLRTTAGVRVRSVPTESGALDPEPCERSTASRASCEVGLAHSVFMDEPLRPTVRTQESALHSSTVTRIRRSAVRSRPRLESVESRGPYPYEALGCGSDARASGDRGARTAAIASNGLSRQGQSDPGDAFSEAVASLIPVSISASTNSRSKSRYLSGDRRPLRAPITRAEHLIRRDLDHLGDGHGRSFHPKWSAQSSAVRGRARRGNGGLLAATKYEANTLRRPGWAR